MTNSKQIVPANPGWYAVFESEDGGKRYTDYYPVAAIETWIEAEKGYQRLLYSPFVLPKDEVREA